MLLMKETPREGSTYQGWMWTLKLREALSHNRRARTKMLAKKFRPRLFPYDFCL